jgi:hypothetical protein
MDLVVDPRTKEVCAVETITENDQRVLQVTIDNDVCTCAGIKRDGHEIDEESQDPYIDLQRAAFEALRHSIALGVPACFSEWEQPTNMRRGAGGGTTPISFFNFPVAERNTALAECSFDAPLLKWVELLEHQRADAGEAYANALTAYDQKSKDHTEWLAHTAVNEWPSADGLSSRPMPYVDYERIKHPERARVLWSEMDQFGASVHLEKPQMTAPGAEVGGLSHRVIVRGDPKAILKRCTKIFLRGEVMELSEILCDYVLVAVDAMKDNEAEEAAGFGQPEVISFAERW